MWTVLGGVAGVLALLWAIHVGRGGTTTDSNGSLAHTATSQPTAAPIGTLQSSGMWIAQLASIRVTAGSAQLQQALDEIKTEIPGAQYLDSSNFASLNPGYWVIYYNGSFSNGNQALSYCADHGQTTRDQCIGRFLSNSVGDKSFICLPPAGSQTTGCYHSGTTALRTTVNRTGREQAA